MPDKDCPSLLSLGSIERKGYTVIWNYGYLPCLVAQESQKIKVLDIRANLPMLMKKGVSDLKLNKEVIEALTGVKFIDGELRIKRCRDELPPKEAEELPSRGRKTLKERLEEIQRKEMSRCVEECPENKKSKET